MKKNNWTLILYIILGLLGGTLLNRILSSVDSLSFLTQTFPIEWKPAANLQFLRFDLYFELEVSVLSLAGLIAALWIYRKWR